MANPSERQIENHIRQSARDSFNVGFTTHARVQMRARHVNDPMVMDTLCNGTLAMPPEPDIRHPGLKCRMQRFVAGMDVAVVVNVEYPSPQLTVITVIDVTRG